LRGTLDYVPDNMFATKEELCSELSQRLNVVVTGVRLLSVNYVTEVIKAEISYKS